MGFVRSFRLSYGNFWVGVRMFEVNGRWTASADTPDGPSLGIGITPMSALVDALDAFEGAIDELLATAPRDLIDRGAFLDS